MIKIIPSIWIYKGRCMTSRKGDPSKSEEYHMSPIDVAQHFEANGVKQVHLVDLEGAHAKRPINLHVIEAIRTYTGLKIDFSGGVSTDGDIATVLESGADFITAATIAYNDPELFCSWIMSYGRENMTLAADNHGGKLVVKGWKVKTEINIEDHISFFVQRGLKYVKTTDLDRVGNLQGPCFDLYESLIKKFPDVHFIASGGVSSVDDIKKLNDIGLWGVHFGNAFYNGNIKIEDLKDFV